MADASAAALLQRGLQVLATGQEELALQFFQRGLELEPRNADLLKASGEILMDLDRVSEAVDFFRRCLDVDPEDGGLWMYLGQLSSEQDALENYEKGVQVLQKQIAEATAANELVDAEMLGRQLCAAYCSLAELFMSDLCFETDAESRCENYLKLALEASQDNPQALQGMASLRISQQRPEEAKPFILRAAGIIDDLMERRDRDDNDGGANDADADADADADDVDMDTSETAEGGEDIATMQQDGATAAASSHDADNSADMDDEAMDELDLESLIPPYEFRAATCRILIELELFPQATKLLERLVEESDQIAEVWYLLAQCHLALGAFDAALECLERAEELYDELIKFDASLSNDERFSTLAKNIQLFKARTEEILKSRDSNGQVAAAAAPAPPAP